MSGELLVSTIILATINTFPQGFSPVGSLLGIPYHTSRIGPG